MPVGGAALQVVQLGLQRIDNLVPLAQLILEPQDLEGLLLEKRPVVGGGGHTLTGRPDFLQLTLRLFP